MGDTMQYQTLPTHKFDPYDKKAQIKKKQNFCRNVILFILVVGIVLAFKFMAELTQKYEAYIDSDTEEHPGDSHSYELNMEDVQLQWSHANLEFEDESSNNDAHLREMTDDTEYTFLENN